ncbi:MAG TPA: TetR/AcrR family transcriptional regulator [Acidimicrobiales bacterium]|nr:TetR/AcrR family transcriptional regulator [Acidimicrobiales bacterium]
MIAPAAPTTPGPRAGRARNPRGEGARLADDIVTAALALIEREGSVEALTLRAVAREVGIAAPSIYAHFDGREAILLAVVRLIFDELASVLGAAVAAAPDDPVEQLVAGCEAYVAFGLERPARYAVLFSSDRDDEMCGGELRVRPDGRPSLEFGGEAFDILVAGLEQCVESGASASTSPIEDAVAVWVALHGTVSLWTSLPQFPWPRAERFVRDLVLRLARIDVVAAVDAAG